MGWEELLSLVLQGAGMFGASSEAKKQNKLAEQAMGQQQDWANRQWQYQEPGAQNYMQILQGLQPTQQNMLAQLAGIFGAEPGSAINLPTQQNASIPTYLRSAMQLPEGSPQRTLADYFMAYNGPESSWLDAMKDIQNGEPLMRRIQRQFGTDKLPEGYTTPALTTGGGQVNVPQTGTNAPAGEGAGAAAGPFGQTPDWQQPFTPEQISSLLEGADFNVNQAAQQMSGNLAADLARRGLGGMGSTSSLDMSARAGLDNLQRNMLAKNRANVTSMGIERGNYLRNEGANNATQLFNMLTGQQNALRPNIDMSPYMNMAGNQANYYGNQANMYGQAAGQAGAGLGSMLGQLATWNRFQNPSGGGGNTNPGSGFGTNSGISSWAGKQGYQVGNTNQLPAWLK